MSLWFTSSRKPIQVPQRASVRAYTIKSYFAFSYFDFFCFPLISLICKKNPLKAKKLLGGVNLIFTVASLHALWYKSQQTWAETSRNKFNETTPSPSPSPSQSLSLSSSLSLSLSLTLSLSLSLSLQEPIRADYRLLTGAHNPERANAINSCNGVFTTEFIFR